jgi:hypothetical protein
VAKGFSEDQRPSREVGGFPEVLTEDAYLGNPSDRTLKRFGLVSSVITESAAEHSRAFCPEAEVGPRLSHLPGPSSCGSEFETKVRSSASLLAPLSCSLVFIGWFLMAVEWIASLWTAVPGPAFSFQRWCYASRHSRVWRLIIHTLWVVGMKRSISFVILLPYYWSRSSVSLPPACSSRTRRCWGKNRTIIFI